MFNVLLLYFIDPFIICHNARPDMKSSYAPKFQDTRTDVFSLHLTKDIRIFSWIAWYQSIKDIVLHDLRDKRLHDDELFCFKIDLKLNSCQRTLINDES